MLRNFCFTLENHSLGVCLAATYTRIWQQRFLSGIYLFLLFISIVTRRA
jgi:hypothetical protein